MQNVYYYISIKTAARRKTFLYAIEAQMLQEAVLMEFRVSKQPCYTNSRVAGIFKGSFRWLLPHGPKQKAYSCLNKGVNLLRGEIPFCKLMLTSSSSSHCHSPSAVELSQKPNAPERAKYNLHGSVAPLPFERYTAWLPCLISPAICCKSDSEGNSLFWVY